MRPPSPLALATLGLSLSKDLPLLSASRDSKVKQDIFSHKRSSPTVSRSPSSGGLRYNKLLSYKHFQSALDAKSHWFVRRRNGVPVLSGLQRTQPFRVFSFFLCVHEKESTTIEVVEIVTIYLKQQGQKQIWALYKMS